VTEGKPAAFKKKHMFLKVGTGANQGVASQSQKGSKLKNPSSTTCLLKSCQKWLQEFILKWKLMLKTICQPPSTPVVPSIASTTAV
jgi:hypothetical protein